MGKSPGFWQSLRLPALFILLIWLIHLFQMFAGMDLGYLGIYPRHFFGLRGIFFAPLLHADFIHLLNNSIPLFALGALLMFFYPKVAVKSFFFIYILTGFAVWLLARQVFHIGASGVVYGLVAFVFWTGIFRRNLKSIVLGLIVAFYYSGMFLGILPNQQGISWESHLLGGIVGIFAAYWFREDTESDEEPTRYSWENEIDGQEDYFLERDVFNNSKQEKKDELNSKNDPWTSSGTW